jgi:type II secretory pathway component PulK
MIQLNRLLNDDKKTYDEKQKGLLTRFLQSEDFGLEDEDVDNIVNAIKDWIDEDDDPTGLGGAENSYYQGLETPYSCKNAPVEFLEELQHVRWIKENKELYERISPYLSPHGDDGKINLNTAHPLVLRALSDETTEDPEMVESMDEYRNDEDNDLKSINWDDRVGMRGVNHDSALLTTSSTFFEIESEGQKRVEDKEGNIEWLTVKRVTATVQRKKDEFDILSWKIE